VSNVAVSRASRPNVTAEVVTGLTFARACVLDQQSASHSRGDYSWDYCYTEALAALDHIVACYERSMKKCGAERHPRSVCVGTPANIKRAP
jgi:DUF971 family protein